MKQINPTTQSMNNKQVNRSASYEKLQENLRGWQENRGKNAHSAFIQEWHTDSSTKK
ncbi:MAG: hypothetical protein WBO07_08290 [Formosimonas sp.]